MADYSCIKYDLVAPPRVELGTLASSGRRSTAELESLVLRSCLDDYTLKLSMKQLPLEITYPQVGIAG